MHITVSFATRSINKGHTTVQDDLYTISFYYNASKIVLSLFEYDITDGETSVKYVSYILTWRGFCFFILFARK